jgi:hypothetical protein
MIQSVIHHYKNPLESTGVRTSRFQINSMPKSHKVIFFLVMNEYRLGWSKYHAFFLTRHAESLGRESVNPGRQSLAKTEHRPNWFTSRDRPAGYGLATSEERENFRLTHPSAVGSQNGSDCEQHCHETWRFVAYCFIDRLHFQGHRKRKCSDAFLCLSVPTPRTTNPMKECFLRSY